MRKLKLTILLIILLTTLFSLFSVSKTYAKYTSIGTASDKARIAKWKVKVDDKDFGKGGLITTINLFQNVNELDANENVSNADDEHVVDADPGKKAIIAPGTGGYLYLPNIENASEVRMKYHLELEYPSYINNVIDKVFPNIEYSIDNSNWTSDITEIKTNEAELNIGEVAAQSTIIYWRWRFETGADDADTEYGIASPDTEEYVVDGWYPKYEHENNEYFATYNISVKIIATQID